MNIYHLQLSGQLAQFILGWIINLAETMTFFSFHFELINCGLLLASGRKGSRRVHSPLSPLQPSGEEIKKTCGNGHRFNLLLYFIIRFCNKVYK